MLLLSSVHRFCLQFIFLSFVLYSFTAWAFPLADVSISDEQYHEVYDFLDRMVAKKAVGRLLKNTRPYSRGEVATILQILAKNIDSGKISLSSIEQKRLFRLMRLFTSDKSNYSFPPSDEYLLRTQGENYRFILPLGVGGTTITRNYTGRERQTGYAILMRPTVIGQVKDNFAFYSDLKFYYLAGTTFEIPKTEARRIQPGLNSYTAALTVSYAKFKLPWFELLLGKDNLSWGPGRHGALLVSDNPLPMNMVKLTAWYKRIKFHAFTGILGSNIGKKYLSGHRLEFNLWDKAILGIGENIVYGDRFEIVYINPFQLYTVTEMPPKVVKGRSVESPDNTLISGDFDVLLIKNLEFYGEILIDDFQPNYGLRSHLNWGSKWGVLLGCYYIDPFSLSDTDFRVEYAFINQYTYTHDPIITTYTHFDSVIGHHIGADADDLFLEARHWFTDKHQGEISFELERHGEGNVNKPHPPDAPYDEEWEFLSGITESTYSVSLSLSYTSVGRYLAEFAYTLSRVKNVDNQLSRNATEHQLVLRGQYRF